MVIWPNRDLAQGGDKSEEAVPWADDVQAKKKWREVSLRLKFKDATVATRSFNRRPEAPAPDRVPGLRLIEKVGAKAITPMSWPC